MITVMVHGFWGSPKDWNPVLMRLPLSAEVWTPDLYEPGPLSPENEISFWANHFLSALDQKFGAQTAVQIVGYSMGARLLLHALKHEPKRFQRSLLLSGNPFLQASERASREQWESLWIKRFETESQAVLEKEWNSQEIFQNSPSTAKRFNENLRRDLVLSLKNWSILKHTVHADNLKMLPESITYAFGALDQKYSNIAKTLQDLAVKGQIKNIPNAGHRLLSDAPAFVAEWIQAGL